MDLEFAYYASLLKRIARNQMVLDKQFAKELLVLQRKLYAKKVSPKAFWEQYKKALLKSVEKNKKALTGILKKTDKEMKARFSEAERKKAKGEPPIDLSLPK